MSTGIVPLHIILVAEKAILHRARINGTLGKTVTITPEKAGELTLAALTQLHYVTSSMTDEGTLIEIIASKELVSYAKSKGWKEETK